MDYSKPVLLFLTVTLVIAGCQSESDSEPNKKQQASTHRLQSNSMEVTMGWVRPTTKGGNSAGYLDIYNGTSKADTLVAVSSDVAVSAAVHESFDKDDLSGMRPAGKLHIAANSSLKLEPGSLHIMLMQLNQNLAEGDSISFRLDFSEAGMKQTKVAVKISDFDM